jgi:hypothetical protein
VQRSGRWLATAGLALTVAACQASVPVATSTLGPAATPAPTMDATPAPTLPAPATAAPSATPTSGASAVESPSGGTSSTVAVDATLLEHLPATVGGATLTADPATAATIATDPTLATAASAIAVALAVSPGGSSDDLAISSVVQLRPGIYTDPFFTDWRSSYDQAACAQAGGAVGTGDQQIAGRHVFVGSCGSGAFTYHVHLPGDILVSVTSVGPGDLGALVMAGLR